MAFEYMLPDGALATTRIPIDQAFSSGTVRYDTTEKMRNERRHSGWSCFKQQLPITTR
jgi:hypothetical protein